MTYLTVFLWHKVIYVNHFYINTKIHLEAVQLHYKPNASNMNASADTMWRKLAARNKLNFTIHVILYTTLKT